jgi:FkbM family methyltransferase
MTAFVDAAPFGARSPNALKRAVIALTRRLPDNWLGLRLAILMRRIVMSSGRDEPIDTELWGLHLRLYPRRNGCEKNALFTPQMFDVVERGMLAREIDDSLRRGGDFVFVDIGANVGLYSLFVAQRAGERANILAIEPQPGIADRFAFNFALNPDLSAILVRQAVAGEDGDAELAIDARDSGGTSLRVERLGGAAERVPVRCRTLLGLLRDHGMTRVDALKIDVEGAEDVVLTPFLAGAPDALLPRWILIEDARDAWRSDVFAALRRRGYAEIGRSAQNVVMARGRQMEAAA